MAALFGRGDELRALDDALAACRQGTGQVVVITGAAGIGKTSLCDALRARFGAAGVPVLAGTCLPDAGAEIAYAPFVTAWQGAPAAGFADLLAGVARLGPVSAGIARAWLADRVLAQLTSWSAEQQVVLVVEDAQWIDPSSRALLDALVRVAARLPLLIVLTAQDQPEPVPWLVELSVMAHVRALALGPLPTRAARALARAVGTPGVDVDAVLRRSDGHPLFTVELARCGGGTLPPTLRALLANRVRGLGTDGARLLAAVALAGDWASTALCAAVAGERSLRTAAGSQLVTVDGDRVRLRHELLGEVARAEEPPDQRLYRQVAAALDAGPAPPAMCAGMWAAAGEPELARDRWLAAGSEAARTHAYQEAAQAYRHAIAIHPDTDAVLGAADALRWAGDLDGALALARTGLAELAVDDAAGRARLLDGVRRYRYAAGRVDDAFDALREAREAAVAARDPAISATVEVAEAGRLLVIGRYEEGMTASRRAAALVRDRPATGILALAHSTEGMCLAQLGQVDGGLALLRSAQRHADRDGGVRTIARVAANHAYVLANASRYGECARVCRSALDALDALGVADAVGGSLRYNLVTALVALGRWDEADRECAQGSASPRTRGLLLACRAVLDGWRGGERAAGLLASAAELVDSGDPVVAAELAYAEAVSACAAGRYRAAVLGCRAALAPADLVPQPGDRLRLLAIGLGALADLQLARGRMRRFDDAAIVVSELLVARDKAIGSWPAPSPEMDLLGRQCDAEAARLDPPTSRSRVAQPDVAGQEGAGWEGIAAGWAALAMPYHAAYAYLRHAEALVDTRQAGTAEAPLRAAYDEAMRLGAEPLRREAERVARRGKLPLPDSAGERPSLHTLTRREQEVLELVACGRTNRDIAQVLVISERTAGVHVSRILAKLGAANRAEAAHLARTKDT
jgi:DNA-binding CsgD family transcriptional regulator/tetratricopeptide (TPR) repeat protein